MSAWRDKAAPIIATVLRRTAGQGEKEIAKALHDAYPFGERSMWPYKIWLDEIARQRGKTTGRMNKNKHDRRGRILKIDEGQGKLL